MAVTEAELDVQLQDIARLAHHLWATQTIPADLETLSDGLVGDFGDQLLAAAKGFRASVGGAFAGDLKALVERWADNVMVHLVDKPNLGFDLNWIEIRDYWEANDKHVKSRGITFGSPTGSTTGTGTITRLTVDRYGRKIDTEQASVKTLKCVRDQTLGGAIRHEEVFEFSDAAKSPDRLQVLGTGGTPVEIAARSSRDSLLSNSAFHSVGGSLTWVGTDAALAASNSLTDWEFVTGAIEDHDLDRLEIAEEPLGTANPHSFYAKAAFKIRQYLSLRNVTVNRRSAYHLSVWVMPEASANGNVILGLGSKTFTTTIASLTDDAWNYVQIDVDEDRYAENWNTTDPAVTLEWTGTGACRFHAMVFCEMIQWPLEPDASAGTFWHVGAGIPATKWIVGDTKTCTDTISSDSKINKLLSFLGKCLPHVPNATQVTAAGGRTLTFANSGGSDTITASSGSFISDGFEAGMLVTIAGTSSNNMTTGPLASVTATVLTFDSTTSLTNEGPLAATATLNATAQVTDPA